MISPTASSRSFIDSSGGTDYVLGTDIKLLNENLGAMILTIVCPKSVLMSSFNFLPEVPWMI